LLTTHPKPCRTAIGLALLVSIVLRPGPGLATARHFGPEQAIALRGISDLAWSADGRRLAFVVADPDTVESATNYDVYLADLARGGVRRLTLNPKGDGSPTFSPGGDTIAYVGTRVAAGDTRSTIWMMSLRGGDPWPFGHYDESIGEVHWSPDGRWLAYTKNDTLPGRVVELRRGKYDRFNDQHFCEKLRKETSPILLGVRTVRRILREAGIVSVRRRRFPCSPMSRRVRGLRPSKLPRCSGKWSRDCCG